MRNPTLKQNRDRAIVQKFYELYDVKRRRMDDVLTDLSQNYFFLDPNYIYSRIFYDRENNQYYNELLAKKKEKSIAQ
jgi:hypothetical protein